MIENSPLSAALSEAGAMERSALSTRLRALVELLSAAGEELSQVDRAELLMVYADCNQRLSEMLLTAVHVQSANATQTQREYITRQEISTHLSGPDVAPLDKSVSFKWLDDLPDAALVVLDDKIVFANEQFCDIFEFDQLALLGASVSAQLADASFQPFERLTALLDAAAFEPAFDFQVSLLSGTGHKRCVSASARQYQAGSGAPCVITIRDVTELQRLLEEAQAASNAKTSFMANMTHEIRTPLGAIIGISGLLIDSELEGEQLENVETIEKASKSLLELVNNILDVSRIEMGKVSANISPFALPALLEEIGALFRPSAAIKGLELTWANDVPNAGKLCSDPAKIRQVLTNLVGNAIKFTRKGAVHVSASIDKTDETVQLLLAVSDSGPGIPSERVEEMFAPFEQLESGFNRIEGTGLGLSISRALAEVLDGTLTYSPNQPCGSCFELRVPYVEGASAEAMNAQASSVSDRGTKTDSIVMKEVEIEGVVSQDTELLVTDELQILVAEDNPLNRKLIGQQLRRLGWRFCLAENGREAIEMLEANPKFQLILMDCQMPEIDGLEATRLIRAMPDDRKNIPIIALTANNSEKDRENCFAAGMNDFVAKPAKVSQLNDILKHWSEQRRGG